DEARRDGRAARLRASARREPSSVGGNLERTDHLDRRRSALASARRRSLLLPSRVSALLVPLQHLDVRAGVLAELPLLPRPCHVGHRGLHLSHAAADRARIRVHATGDEDYLRETAWPVLEGVANWVVSRAVKSERGYEIKQVIGVAEQTDPVDNNAYVNMGATRLLQEAAAFACRLKRPDADRWNEIARGMYLPVDHDRGIILNHDRYSTDDRGVAASTPEALAGLFPFNYSVE